jgi:hypothetical protein
VKRWRCAANTDDLQPVVLIFVAFQNDVSVAVIIDIGDSERPPACALGYVRILLVATLPAKDVYVQISVDDYDHPTGSRCLAMQPVLR